MGQLPHLDDAGNARMVDISDKPSTARFAAAEAIVRMAPATAEAVFTAALAKGDAVAVSRVAGIQAAKRTADLIPLCHPLAVSSVDISIERVDDGARIMSRVGTTGPTGVEMEALVAVSIAALTMYDMVKAVERGAEIGPVRLLEKSGGRSGTWSR